jgi:hypothetical protein
MRADLDVAVEHISVSAGVAILEPEAAPPV